MNFLIIFLSILLLLLPDLIINYIYFFNIDLFYDIVLTKKNKKKLDKWIERNYLND